MEVIGVLLLLMLIYGLWGGFSDLKPNNITHPQEHIEEEPKKEKHVKLSEPYLTLSNYIGQTKRIDYLLGHIKQAKLEQRPLSHIILWGSGGLGKSTLVRAIAYEMGGRFIEIVPANLRNTKDLQNLFFDKICNCGKKNHFSVNKCVRCKATISINFTPALKIVENDILFLEECHGLKPDIEEALYSLMQDSYVQLRFNGMDQRVEFPPITVGGATTLLGDLNKPFRDRFVIDIHLEPYKENEIIKISSIYAKSKNIDVNEEALNLIATFSYGIPRIAKKFITDSYTRGKVVTKKEVTEIANLLDIDKFGLNKMHRKALDYIHKRNQAGERAIASTIGVPLTIYKEVYEPPLMHKELIMQGSRGRVLTDEAKKRYFKGCSCKYCKPP